MHDPDGELRADPGDAPNRPPDRTVATLLALSGLVLTGVIAYWLWSTGAEQQALAPQPQPGPPVPDAPAVAAPGAVVRYPVPASGKPVDAQDLPAALAGLLGARAAATFLQAGDFPRRFAATVDSLAREHSPPSVWPVLATPGRFLVQEGPEGPVVAAENSERYAPLVLLASTVDAPSAAGLYRRMYPLLQKAYAELGFGQRHLNDRVVEVIDLLLATPEAPEAPRLQLLAVRGTVPSQQPWLRYQFQDPALEALSAGQKVLVRVGPVNRQRLKSKLAELRTQLAGPPASAASAAR
ncbi:MAG TPA: DUF3014 domain-containing protein [Ramlibacter sp.]